MSATEIMQRIEELPAKEQEEIFILLTKKVVGSRGAAKPWLGKKLSFEEACGVVFRENRELLSDLAK
jgi:hypothetical protein